ncbi:EpsG family protein [Aeromonas enteropelogenes]|uniref:EpsG family protein n=1 Tax=Aeromonas enteropelogenes TaxID=29489 RepID=UPI003BA0EDB1
MCKRNFENDLFFISLACIYCAVFILISYHYSLNLEFEGDTQQYFYAFNEIKSTPFPWRGEFVTSCIMLFVNTMGGDFRFYLFVCLLMWIPVLFHLMISAKRNFFIVFLCLFFLLPYFIGNVLFLIRQFHAALFFLFFVFYCHKRKNARLITALLFTLSVGSHISAVIWFVFFNNKIKVWLAKPIVVFLMVTISFVMFLMQIDAVSMLVNSLIELSNVLGVVEIERKLLFYTSGESMDAVPVTYQYILLSFMIVFFSVFLLVKKKDDNSFYLLSLTQSLLLLVLSDNVVAANRFGFFAFYFSIPLVIILFSFCFKKRRVTF